MSNLPTSTYFRTTIACTALALALVTLIGTSACDTDTDTDTDSDTDEPTSIEPLSIKCGTSALDLAEKGELFYEIFDLENDMVWGTWDFTPDEFAALQLPASFSKNQIRESSTDSGRFLRSPGCANRGEYTEEELFGKDFQHIVDFVATGIIFDEVGLLRGAHVLKYHEIEYTAGRTVAILTSPSGDRYIRVSRDAERITDVPTIPDGWMIGEYTLQQPLMVELFNMVENIRADNQDSFQGPIPDDVDLDAIAVRLE